MSISIENQLEDCSACGARFPDSAMPSKATLAIVAQTDDTRTSNYFLEWTEGDSIPAPTADTIQADIIHFTRWETWLCPHCGAEIETQCTSSPKIRIVH